MDSVLDQLGSGLNNIVKQAQLYQALLDLGKECLPAKMAQHLVGVSFEDNILICQLDDSLWATKLRFYSPSLLNIYQQHFPHLNLSVVKIQIIPLAERKIIKPVTMEKLTEIDAKEMLSLSQNVTEKGLKQALTNLSKHST